MDRFLGSGGMGAVVAATHLELQERVAIKFLLPEVARNKEAVARFLREARAAAMTKSEHVLRVMDIGNLDDGTPFMVMEYLDGADLGAHLAAHGVLPIQHAVGLLLQTCEAVADAHASGIIHRDLKPSNVVLVKRNDGSDLVKVLDFGISKVASLSASGPEMDITKTSSTIGSPLYMSPEQMRSPRDVDTRADIWALGATLYELLTGSTPFTAASVPELCTKVLMEPAPRLRSARPDAPAGLEAVILRCLEKNPNARYQNIAELAIALAEFGPKRSMQSAERVSRILRHAGMPSSTVVSPPSSADAPSSAEPVRTDHGTMASWGHTARPGAGGRRTLLLTGVGTLLVVGAAAAVWSPWGRSPVETNKKVDPDATPTRHLSATTREARGELAAKPSEEPGPPLAAGESTHAADAVVPGADAGTRELDAGPRGHTPPLRAEPVVFPAPSKPFQGQGNVRRASAALPAERTAPSSSSERAGHRQADMFKDRH